MRQVFKAVFCFFDWMIIHLHFSTCIPDYNQIMIDSPSAYMILLYVSTSDTCQGVRWQINENERIEQLMVMLLYCCGSRVASMACDLKIRLG